MAFFEFLIKGFASGFLQAAGIFAFFFCLLVVVKLAKGDKNKSSDKIKADKSLLKAFTVFKNNELDNERYENQKELEGIIKRLENGEMPDEINQNYVVEKKTDLVIKSKEGSGGGSDETRLVFDTYYNIRRKKK